MSSFAVILPAAGASRRFHDKHYKKPFIPLANRPVWLHSAERFINRDDVKQVIIVVSQEDESTFCEKFGPNIAILGIDVVIGGKERADSVANALAKVHDDIDYIAVHDAARPCLADEWIDAVFAAAEKSGAAILALPISGTIKRVSDDHTIDETVSRKGLWEAQTPQVFRRDLLLKAYAQRGDQAVTDEAQALELMGHPVTIVEGSPINMKITTKDDMKLAAFALKALPKPTVFGSGNPFEGDDMWR